MKKKKKKKKKNSIKTGLETKGKKTKKQLQ